jgi:hypothetical protein
MTKKRFRICEPCADEYLPFQIYNSTGTRYAICDTCNCWALTEFVQSKPGGGIFFGAPTLRDYDKILNELETAYAEASSSGNFIVAEDIAEMIEKFEKEKAEGSTYD